MGLMRRQQDRPVVELVKPYTAHEQALLKTRERFGTSAYCEDNLTYKLVGFGRGSKKEFAVGDTWDEAIQALEKKVNQ